MRLPVVSLLPHAGFERNYHREDTPHVICKAVRSIFVVSNPELVSVTQYDVMFLLVPFLETHSDKGKVALADLEMSPILLNIINR